MLSLSALLNFISDRLVPFSLRRDPEVFRRAKRVAMFGITFLVWEAVFAALYTAMASPRCGAMALLTAPWIIGSLVALKRGASPAVCGNVLCVGGWIGLTALGAVTGGSTAPALFWFTCLPFVAILTGDVGCGIAWTLIPFATILLFGIAEGMGIDLPQDVPAENAKFLYFAVLSGLVLCHFLLASVRLGVEQRARVAIKEVNRRLAQARRTLETLEAGFDFSIEEWEKLKREKAALERALKIKMTSGPKRAANEEPMAAEEEDGKKLACAKPGE